jgi:GGDEF domain-containing protein
MGPRPGSCSAPRAPTSSSAIALAAGLALASETLRRQVPRRWPELGRLLSRRPSVAAASALGQSDDARGDLFAAASAFIRELAAVAPVALLLDDVHWADSASLGLLVHLARDLAAHPVLLLTTFLAQAHLERVPLSLVIVDVDHFKHVNDRFGHATGDEVLQRLGATLRRSFRDQDVVARAMRDAAISMYAIAGRWRCWHAALTQCAAVRGPAARSSGDVRRRVAEFPRDGSTSGLYRSADDPYNAKDAGRARVGGADSTRLLGAASGSGRAPQRARSTGSSAHLAAALRTSACAPLRPLAEQARI